MFIPNQETDRIEGHNDNVHKAVCHRNLLEDTHRTRMRIAALRAPIYQPYKEA